MRESRKDEYEDANQRRIEIYERDNRVEIYDETDDKVENYEEPNFQMSEYERRKYTNDEIEECGVKEERQYRRGDC